MSLQNELDAQWAEFVRKAPVGRAELYESMIENLRRQLPIHAALKLGDKVPGFTLPNAFGKPVSLSELLRPAVLIFYRGAWCPYCNIQLRAYQRALSDISAAGASVLAISPQLPDGSLSTKEMNQLSFDVLSDVGNHVARAFGRVYVLTQDLRTVLKSNGKDLSVINGDGNWELPLAATYVITRDKRIVHAAIEADHRQRLDPDVAVAALRSLQINMSKVA